MRGIACLGATELMAKRRTGLSNAERLRLEDHLQQCDACRADAHDLSALTRLSDASVAPLTDRRRARTVESALQAIGSQPEQVVAARRGRGTWIAGGVIAAAAAAGIALSVLPADNTETPAATAPAPQQPAVATLLDGTIEIAGIALSAEDDKKVAGIALSAEDDKKVAGIALSADQLRADADITTERGASLSLAHATVRLAPATRVRWDVKRSALTLVGGAVDAHVAPGPKRPFRVATSRFVVHVIGTKFSVTTRGVSVKSGVVQVRDLRGNVLAARLTAGQSWSVTTTASAARKTKRKPAVDAPSRITSAAKRSAPSFDPADGLRRARTLLASGDVGEARRLVDKVRALHPKRALRAEADTLLAEAEMVSGNASKAVRLYVAVADRYRGSAAAQNALFAAARIENRQGHAAAARKLYQRYLDRYPRGRFSGEAKRHLGALPRQ